MDVEVVEILDGQELRRRALDCGALTANQSSARYTVSPSGALPDLPAALEYLDLSEFTRERRRPPPWVIGLTRQFKKDTDGMDRKVLGRVLAALSELTELECPLRPHGDTFKPLTGELAGQWRYRLGDMRLILLPSPKDARIDLIHLAARGSVYE